MPNCQEATHRLSEAQERKLSLHERLTLNMHLMICSGCRNFSDQMALLRKAARTYAKKTDMDTPDSIR